MGSFKALAKREIQMLRMESIFAMVVGSCTDVIASEGSIVTAGGYDTHTHMICPRQAYEAVASGITTMPDGGIEPRTGTNATTCTPGKEHIGMCLKPAASFLSTMASVEKVMTEVLKLSRTMHC